jgi:hypothetical protein
MFEVQANNNIARNMKAFFIVKNIADLQLQAYN